VRVTRDAWTLTGDRLDYDDRTRMAVVTGGPAATLRDAVMTAETITVWLAEERAAGEGTVVLRRGDLVGRAPRVEVVARDNRATLLGGARVERGQDLLTAEEIDVDLDGIRATARGSPRLIITPP
jgi:lipopolysaccharide export system protein LptA